MKCSLLRSEIAERVSVSGTIVVEVFASVVIGVVYPVSVNSNLSVGFKRLQDMVEELVVSVATTTKSIPISTAEVVTTASASVVILDELTLAQTLIEIKIAKPKPVTTTAGLRGLYFMIRKIKYLQLKSKRYDEIQKLFDKEMKRVNTFMDMNSEVVKDEHVKCKKDDQEEAEMKRHIEIVKDDDVAIKAIPLATKPLMIVEYKIDKDRRMGYFKLIRADGSSK
ncbi:hypothetical protein Tco_1471670, partial [Tanacetum coccineum]